MAYTHAMRSFSLDVTGSPHMGEGLLKTCLSTGNSRRCSKVKLAPPLPMLLNEVDEENSFVTVMLNGNCVVRCGVPQGDATAEVVTDLPHSVRINNDGQSLYLQTVAYMAHVCTRDIDISITLVDETTDKEETVPVGTLNHDVKMCKSVDFVPFVPTKAVLTLSGKKQLEGSSLKDAKFLKSVSSVLRSMALNPGQGSMSAAVLQNHAKCLPLYDEIVGKSGWLQFLKACVGLEVLQLTEEEINNLNLGPLVKVGEPRVVLRGVDWKTRDADRAKQVRERERALLDTLVSMFRSSGECLTQQELMEILGEDSNFLFFVQPSLAAVSRFIMQNKDIFTWPTHPEMTCTAGLRHDRPGEVSLTKNSSERIPINAVRKTKPK